MNIGHMNEFKRHERAEAYRKLAEKSDRADRLIAAVSIPALFVLFLVNVMGGMK